MGPTGKWPTQPGAMTSHLSQPKWAGHTPCVFYFGSSIFILLRGRNLTAAAAMLSKVSFLTSEKYITVHSLALSSSPSFLYVGAGLGSPGFLGVFVLAATLLGAWQGPCPRPDWCLQHTGGVEAELEFRPFLSNAQGWRGLLLW